MRDIGKRARHAYPSVLDPERRQSRPSDTAQAVETDLRLAPVRIEHALAEIRPIPRIGQQQNTVASNRPGTIRQRPRDHRPRIVRQVEPARIDHGKVVPAAMAFDKFETHQSLINFCWPKSRHGTRITGSSPPR